MQRVIPAAFSVLHRSMQVLGRVNPCDLCIVIDQESLSSSCCLSYADPNVSEVCIAGIMGIQLSGQILGPLYVSSNFTITAMGKEFFKWPV